MNTPVFIQLKNKLDEIVYDRVNGISQTLEIRIAVGEASDLIDYGMSNVIRIYVGTFYPLNI